MSFTLPFFLKRILNARSHSLRDGQIKKTDMRQEGRLEIPSSAGDISVEWMRNALAFGGWRNDVMSRDFRVEPIGTQMGHIGTTYRCRLTYSDASSHNVIVKAPSSNKKILRHSEKLHFYRNEFAFYKKIAPLAPIQTPSILFGQINDGKNFVFVMEDLSHLNVVDQIEGASEDQARRVIRSIAPMHAMFWNQLDRRELCHFKETVPAGRASLQLLYMHSIAAAFERFDDLFSTQTERFVEKLGTRLMEFMKNLENTPKTLVHGDYRLDNMFFGKYGSSDFYVIDWQASGFGCGLHDVAFFLSGNVTTEMRRKVEREILEEYHEFVCRAASPKNFPFAECWRLYRQYILVCFAIIVVIAGAADVIGPRSSELVRISVKRMYAAIEDLEIEEFMPGRSRMFSASKAVSIFSNCVYRTARTLRKCRVISESSPSSERIH